MELDAAFAGGVCRCSTCGTLMTVPADPSRDRAETVTRRDRPDAPAGGGASSRPDTPRAASSRPDAPPGRSTRPDTPGPAGTRPETPGSSGSADLAALARTAPPGSSAASQGVYLTASGKALELAEAVVPTARKRKKVIRATVIGGFVAMVLGIVAVIALAISFVFNSGKPKGTDLIDTVGIDPAVNPIKKTEPNLLTITIESECAIVVDATMYAKQWYPMMRDIIGHEVSLAPSTSFMVIPWSDLTPKSFPAKPEKIGRDRLSDLDASLMVSNVAYQGISPAPYVELALNERADQIILVTGRVLEEAEVKDLVEVMGKRVDVHLDVIVVGDHDAVLQKLAKDNKGRYVSVKTDQLEKWYGEWKK